jgi:hypothetical protein
VAKSEGTHMTNSNIVLAELQRDEALSITKIRKPVGLYSCIGESGRAKGKQNMSAFSVFKTFSAVESLEFFTMAEHRNRLTNLVDAFYISDYSESEVKRFRQATKSLIEKDCIKLVSKKEKIYMINPRLILGSFECMDELIKQYQSLDSKEK